VHGGPEVMRWESVQLPPPRAGQALVRHTAIGVHDLDLEQRRGDVTAVLPCGLGVQALGVVESVAPGTMHLSQGDRVAYAGDCDGTYCEAAIVPVGRLLKVPDSVPDKVAGALLDGLIAADLLHRIRRVSKGDRVLIAGTSTTPGRILGQWASHLGADVVDLAGNAGDIEDAELIRSRGIELAAEAGFDVAFDFIGTATVVDALRSVVPPSSYVGCNDHYAWGDGRAPEGGTKGYSRADLASHATCAADLRELASLWFSAVALRVVKVQVESVYPLRHAPQAHAAQEARGYACGAVMLP